MSRKAWKRTRRELRPIYERQAKVAMARRHLPWWRTVSAALGWSGPARRWTAIWEKRHAAAMRRAEKKTAHFARRKGYTMRKGGQPLPHHIKDFPGVQPDKSWPRPPAKHETPGELA